MAHGEDPPSNPASFAKGFLAGVVLSHFNKQLMLGALVGVAAGMYFEQEYGAPNAKAAFQDFRETVDDILKKASKKS
jgi:hypothetical protein